MFLQAVLVLLFTTASIKGKEDTSAEFENLKNEIFEWQQMTYPNSFYENSMTRYNTYTSQGYEEDKKKVSQFLSHLESINDGHFSKKGKLQYKLTLDMLKKKLDGYKWRLYGALTPMSFLEAKPYPILGLFASMGPNSTLEDLNKVLKIIDSIPDKMSEYKDLMQQAISLNRTMHNVSIIPLIHHMEEVLNKTEEKFIGAAITYIGRLGLNDENNRMDLELKANKSIEQAMDAYGKFVEFLKTEYLPSTRKNISVNSWSSGLYQRYLKWHLDSDVSADEVHKLGLSEAAKIKKRLKSIMDKQDFKGSIAEYMVSIRKKKEFQLKNSKEIFSKYDEILSEIKTKLSKYFRDYPDLPLIIKPMESDGPAASYGMANMDGVTIGVFRLNVFRPTEMPTYEMTALALHEANPGHHFQFSYMARSKEQSWQIKGSVMDFFMIPYQFPFYSAYLEGWGLYCEYLGEEMGLYKTDYDLVGRLAFELLRAYRLVIDTGLHAKQMSRQEGIDLLTNFTGLSEKQASIEVDRYITVPGQACAYKFGELKILELRKKAEKKLGDAFDLKDFHAAILEGGRVSLDILEDVVDDMIEDKLSNTNKASILSRNPSSMFITSLILTYSYYSY